MNCFQTEDTPLFVIVRKSRSLPRFDVRFSEYGYNRQQWIQHLRYLGFEFKVLRDGFGIDIPHPLSPFYYHFQEERKKGKPFNQLLFESFMNELKMNSTVKLMNECV